MKLIACLFLMGLSINVSSQNFDHIKRYKINYALATKGAEKKIAIRSFVSDQEKYLLLVNPQTLNTTIDLARNYTLSNLAWGNVQAIFKKSAYVKAIDLALQSDKKLQNAGIDHAIPKEKGITLTIDLCPSHKGLDRIIFQSLINEFKRIEQPVPLAISVSGKWMLKHEEDLNWLKNLMIQNEIDITWINHSYNHEVNSLPLSENFLLAPGTNLDSEILANEMLMLKYGLTPSAFFRFPGLVSDQQIVEKTIAYGLIPVGSDAWLAKGQQANAGSIVLIHGNGNEEIGVHDFLKLLKAKQIDIKQKQWLLFDLKQGLEKELK
ncbi:polysaccharide deacetylase family protein [Pedobacter boryungensis]|uniref:Polysaccharide deacetylase n=1 Tax=Pedobacter boryungensis TaxID=869962 RepID=A0ABX2DDF4_9SPHI|nr:polysaccharide deacetylase [Pedobacter boryungensis]NQX32067.1 polysaccharide deacetylase [Pedobacter boryungensis]